MEQRKLMLPAFHGEKMERLAGLMEEVAEREAGRSAAGDGGRAAPANAASSRWRSSCAPSSASIPAPASTRCGSGCSAMLAFGDRPISLMPPPKDGACGADPRAGRAIRAFRPHPGGSRRADLRADRRSGGARAPSATTCWRCCSRPGTRTARRCSEQEMRDELMTLLVAGHETTASTLAWAFERLARDPAVLARLVEEVEGDDDAYITATIQETLRLRPVLPNVAPRLVVKPIEVGGWAYPTGCLPGPQRLPAPPRPRHLPRPLRLPPRAFPRRVAGHLHLDPLRRRPPPLPGRELRDARDEDRPAPGPEHADASACRRAPRGRAAAQHHGEAVGRGAGCAFGAGRAAVAA